MFSIIKDGKPYRYKKAVIDCSKDEVITEQSHKEDVNINNIIKKHGMDMIQKTALLKSQEFVFDDVTGNDFQEAMQKVTRAQQTFDDLPSEMRKRFDNNPAKFMDFVHDDSNLQEMYDLGLAMPPEETQPVEVQVVNQPTETPPTEPQP
jgi:hypothetical protein